MALVHVRHIATVTFAKTDQDPLLGSDIAHGKPCLTAIVPVRSVQWRIDISPVRHHRSSRRDFSKAACLRANWASMDICCRLHAPQLTKRRATGLDPVGRGLQNFQCLCLAPVTSVQTGIRAMTFSPGNASNTCSFFSSKTARPRPFESSEPISSSNGWSDSFLRLRPMCGNPACVVRSKTDLDECIIFY